MSKRIIACTLISFALVGCMDDKKVETVDFYKEHSEQRKAVLDECQKNPTNAKIDGNCENATKAERIMRRKSGSRSLQVDTSKPFNS